jgi:hypothetical protein
VNVFDPSEKQQPDTHLRELASILAAGVLRLLEQRSARDQTISDASAHSLHLAADEAALTP